MATSFSKKQSPTGASQANRGLYKKGGSTKKYATGGGKASNIYAKNPATGKEEQMVIKSGKYAFATKKKGGSTKAMPKAMYGKSMMKKGGAMKKYQVAGQTDTAEPMESFSKRTTKTVSVSPKKDYKTTVKQKMGPSGVSTKVTNRRTVKGVLSGAPKAGMMKKGGNTKKK